MGKKSREDKKAERQAKKALKKGIVPEEEEESKEEPETHLTLEKSQLKKYVKKNEELINLEKIKDIETTREKIYGPLKIEWTFKVDKEDTSIQTLEGDFFLSRLYLCKLEVGQTINITLDDEYEDWERQAVIKEIRDDEEFKVEIKPRVWDEFEMHIPQPEFLLYGSEAMFTLTFEPNTVTYERQLKGMHKLVRLYERDPESQLLNYLISGYGVPDATNPLKINFDEFVEKKSYSAFNPIETCTSHDLTLAQNKAIYHAINYPLTLIQGPPGTGKTLTSAHIIYTWLDQELKEGRKGKILVCAPSNISTNNLALKLIELGQEAMKDFKDIKIVRLLAKSHKSSDLTGMERCLKDIQHRSLIENTILNKEAGIESIDKVNQNILKYERKILNNAGIVCVTCSSTEDLRLDGIKFTHVLVDEATQAVEADTIMPIVKCSDKVVLVGDQKQLCPVILNNKAIKEGYKVSMFQRLINEGVETIMLDKQFRMAPAISKFVSKQFYDNKLLNDKSIHSRHTYRTVQKLSKFEYFPSKEKIMFVNCMKGEESKEMDSYRNKGEQVLLVKLILELDKLNIIHSTIKVITPYRLQQAYIKDALCSKKLKDIEVASVDSFQGREAGIIIISCVRTDKIGFLDDERRLNVMMSRAKYGMIILGRKTLLQQYPAWKNMIEYYEDNDALVEDVTLRLQLENNQ